MIYIALDNTRKGCVDSKKSTNSSRSLSDGLTDEATQLSDLDPMERKETFRTGVVLADR